MIVIAMVVATGALYREATGQAPPVPSEEQPEVLTRGPVNEAFAQPVNLENQTGLTAPNMPPADIEEVPPSERPCGRRVRMGAGLLGVGLGQERIYLGQRVLAGGSAGYVLGAGLLDRGGGGLAMGGGLLDTGRQPGD